MSEAIEHGNVVAERQLTLAEAAGELAAFSKALEDQMAFLRSVLNDLTLDGQNDDLKLTMPLSAALTVTRACPSPANYLVARIDL